MDDTRPQNPHMNGKAPKSATDWASTAATLEVQVSMLWHELEEVRSAHLAFTAKVEPHLGNLQVLDRFIVAVRGTPDGRPESRSLSLVSGGGCEIRSSLEELTDLLLRAQRWFRRAQSVSWWLIYGIVGVLAVLTVAEYLQLI